VSLKIKTFGFEDLDHGVKSAFFQHYSTQYGLFHLFGLGRYLPIHHGAEVHSRLTSEFAAVLVEIKVCKIHVYVRPKIKK
jgi:hypothetical protein